MFHGHRLGRQRFVLQYEPQRFRLCRAFRRAQVRKLGTGPLNLVQIIGRNTALSSSFILKFGWTDVKKGDIGRGKSDMYLIPHILVARRSLVPGLLSGTRQQADWIALIFKAMSSNMVLQYTIDRRSEIQSQSGLVE